MRSKDNDVGLTLTLTLNSYNAAPLGHAAKPAASRTGKAAGPSLVGEGECSWSSWRGRVQLVLALAYIDFWKFLWKFDPSEENTIPEISLEF